MGQRILVVGAGIAGLATAVALHRRGHDVTIVEERIDASSGTGISIWPNALAALDVLGLADEVRAAGGGVTAGALRWADGTWLRRPAPQRMIKALGEPLVVIRRAALTAILADALPVGAVRTGSRATAFVDSGDHVRVTLADGTTFEAAAVVGADGVGSAVATHLNGPLRRRYAGYTAWRGVASCAIDADLAGETMGSGVEFGHVPLGRGHTYWFGTERRPEGARNPGGELAYLRSRYGHWADPVPAMLATTDERDVVRTDLYDREPARCWALGPIVLVGDAAHPMRPHLGQGGCQGLEDAVTLAHYVGTGDDLIGAFAQHAAVRGPRTLRLTRESRMIGEIVNARPAVVGTGLMRASGLIPEWLLMRHLATIASRSALSLPDWDGGRGSSPRRR